MAVDYMQLIQEINDWDQQVHKILRQKKRIIRSPYSRDEDIEQQADHLFEQKDEIPDQDMDSSPSSPTNWRWVELQSSSGVDGQRGSQANASRCRFQSLTDSLTRFRGQTRVTNQQPMHQTASSAASHRAADVIRVPVVVVNVEMQSFGY